VTAKYEIKFDPRAVRNLARIDPVIRRRIGAKIEALAADPEPAGCKALKGHKPPVLRIRIGDWRVLYRVLRDEATILMIDVDHRADVYR
jgi:mRNA interferase RelE/StbE